MKDLIIKLSGASGPSGSEKHVREILQELVEPYADQVTTDVLGNLIVYKKGTAESRRKTILLETSMDETGVMAIRVEENGFIRIVPVGALDPARLVGERVRFTTRTWGVVGVEGNKSPKDVTFADLYVDIGAESQAEAEKRVTVGTAAVIDKGAFALGENRVAGKALDNRAGCAVLLDVVSKLGPYPHDLQVVFAVQKEVGSRGVKAAAFRVEADFAIVVGGAGAGDMPNAERSSLRLGKGPAVKVMDRGVVIPSAMKQLLIETAERLGIGYQLEVSPDAGGDAGQILLTRDGILTAGVSIPVRYMQTPSQVIDLRDAEQTSRLILGVLHRFRQ